MRWTKLNMRALIKILMSQSEATFAPRLPFPDEIPPLSSAEADFFRPEFVFVTKWKNSFVAGFFYLASSSTFFARLRSRFGGSVDRATADLTSCESTDVPFFLVISSFLQEEAGHNHLFSLLPDPWHLTVSRRDVDGRIQTWIPGSYPTKPTIMPPFARAMIEKWIEFFSLLRPICFVLNLQVFLTSRNSGDAMIDFSVFRLI